MFTSSKKESKEMQQQIIESAGKIYNYLSSRGEVTINKLRKDMDLDDKRWDIYPLGFSQKNPDWVIVNALAYTGDTPVNLGTWAIHSYGESPRLVSTQNTTVGISMNGYKLIKDGVEPPSVMKKEAGDLRRIERENAKLKQKEETEEEYQRNKGNKDNKVYSDDEEDSASKDEEINELDEQIDEIENVLTSFSEFFGVLFDTHKKYTLEFVDKIIKEYLPKYFKDNSSNFEKNLGVLLVGDMAEYLTQDIIGNIWDDICTILIKYSNHKDDEVRNSACYGLGAFAKATKNNFEKYYKTNC